MDARLLITGLILFFLIQDIVSGIRIKKLEENYEFLLKESMAHNETLLGIIKQMKDKM